MRGRKKTYGAEGSPNDENSSDRRSSNIGSTLVPLLLSSVVYGVAPRFDLTVNESRRPHSYFHTEKVRNIEDIRPLSSAQRELAERFAYASFHMCPWVAKSVTLRYTPDTRKSMYQGQANIKSREDWYTADLKAFAEWIANPNKLDEYLAQRMSAAIGTTS